MKNNRNTKIGLAIAVSGVIGATLIAQPYFGQPESSRTTSTDTAPSGRSVDSVTVSAASTTDNQATATGSAAEREKSSSRPMPPHTFATTADYEAVSAYGPLPRHLQDIRLRKLAYDDDGNLIVNGLIKDLIESLLTASGFDGRERAIARIQEYMTMSLPEPASSQALAILEGYLNYEIALSELQLPAQDNLDRDTLLAQFEQAMEARKQLRRTHLPAGVADALFPHEAYDDFSLQRMALHTDPNLSYEQKQARIAQQEQLLPERTRQRVSDERLRKDVERTVSDMKAEGGFEAEIYQLRRDAYGEETADRLTYFEDTSPDWQQRVALFNQERAHIEQQQHLGAADKEALIAELRQSTFSQKEQVKLAVQNIRNQAARN